MNEIGLQIEGESIAAPFPSLLPDRGPQPPAGLFDIRNRTYLSRISPDWPQAGYLGLPVSSQNAQAALDVGAYVAPAMAGRERVCASRRDAVRPELQAFVPFIARKAIRPIPIQTIPQSSHGASLHNLLTQDCWKRLRRHAYEAAGYVCEICGNGEGPAEAHEIWEYRTPAHPAVEGVQKLVRISCLCHDCHEMFHPGLAQINGRHAEVFDRTSAVNAWTPDETKAFYSWLHDLHAYRSSFDWVLDLSAYASFGIIDIDPSDWVIDETTWRLKAVSEQAKVVGHVQTLPLGVEFALGDAIYPAQSPQIYSRLLEAV